MKNGLKYLGMLILTVVLATFVFSGCKNSPNDTSTGILPPTETTVPPTTQSIEEKIWGRWMVIEDSLQKNGEGKSTPETQELDDFRTLDFFNDATYVSNQVNYSGTYSISGNRILLEGILVETLTYTFKIDSDVLTLFAGESNELSMSFARMN